MLPMAALRLKLATLLADDTSSLAPAVNANKIALVTSPFTPEETLTVADLTLASFTGSTPIAGAAGDQGVALDPVTGQQLITILAPAGGWRWVCTAAPATPQTIYGFALLDAALDTLLGVELLTTPVTISAVGQEIDLGAVTIDFVLQPMS